jgi:hypothetical protein
MALVTETLIDACPGSGGEIYVKTYLKNIYGNDGTLAPRHIGHINMNDD